MRAYQRPWVASGNEEARIASAAALIRFAFGTSMVTEEHRQRLLKDLSWSLTADDGKYATRYRSAAAVAVDAVDWGKHLRHEHVFTRRQLLVRIAAADLQHPSDLEDVLRSAVACVVTPEEHKLLTVFDLTHSGWDRYVAAGIEVLDMASMSQVDVRHLAAAT